MKKTLIAAALFAALGLSACTKPPCGEFDDLSAWAQTKMSPADSVDVSSKCSVIFTFANPTGKSAVTKTTPRKAGTAATLTADFDSTCSPSGEVAGKISSGTVEVASDYKHVERGALSATGTLRADDAEFTIQAIATLPCKTRVYNVKTR